MPLSLSRGEAIGPEYGEGREAYDTLPIGWRPTSQPQTVFSHTVAVIL